jgi:hypothetical protein
MAPIAPTTAATAAPAPPAARKPLERKRLVTAFMLTPLLAGFYPAIFMAEPSVMPIGLALSYVSAGTAPGASAALRADPSKR